MKTARDIRDETTSDLRSVINATRKQIARQERALQAEQKFFDSLSNIIEKQAPELKSDFDDFIPHFTSYINASQNFNASQLRAIEDLNDTVEGFLPIVRIAQARKAALALTKSARSKLDSAKESLSSKVQKNSESVSEARLKVTRRTQKLIDRIRTLQSLDEQYIFAKQRYNAFRQRRTQQSYIHLGTGFTRDKQAEADAWHQIKEVITAKQEGRQPEKVTFYETAQEMEEEEEAKVVAPVVVDAFRPELEPVTQYSQPVVSQNPFDDKGGWEVGDNPF
jgi:hypothetical protein